MAETRDSKEMKKRQREAALNNLNGNISRLASVYLVEQSNFGEKVSDAVERVIYHPAISLGMGFIDPESGQEGNALTLGKNGLIASRIDGKRYTGSINEMQILENAAGIMQDSLKYLTVEDVFGLMGAESSVYEKVKRNLAQYIGKGRDVKDLYVSDLPEEQMKQVIGGYQGFLAYKAVSEATGTIAKQTPGQLEKILSGEETPRQAA